MAAVTETASLYAMVMAALEDELGTRAEIADRLADELADEDLRGALRLTLPRYIQYVDQARRNRVMGVGDPRKKQSRWEKMPEEAWRVELLRQRVCPRGVYKKFGDCGARDVLDMGSDAEQQAIHAHRTAQRYEVLGRLMNKRGHATVADVPEDDLKKVFDV